MKNPHFMLFPSAFMQDELQHKRLLAKLVPLLPLKLKFAFAYFWNIVSTEVPIQSILNAALTDDLFQLKYSEEPL